jgi:uncharacterized damage-inducible protein DinB
MSPREMLIETAAQIPPARALEDLAAADAERRVPGAPHSIAQIVAHLAFWQDWFHARCGSAGSAMPASAGEGWPAVPAGSWPGLRARFLEGLERLAGLGTGPGGLDRALAPSLEPPMPAHYTVGDVLVHLAQHNAHHLGQVVVLRQLLDRWPPAAGSWTW